MKIKNISSFDKRVYTQSGIQIEFKRALHLSPNPDDYDLQSGNIETLTWLNAFMKL